MGIGVLGFTADEVLAHTPRQFFNGLKGKYDFNEQQLKAKRNLLFTTARFNASHIAAGLSKELADSISNINFEWEKEKQEDIIKKFDQEFFSK